MSQLITSFYKFLENPDPANRISESTDQAPTKEVKFEWSFNFGSGKFKFSDISDKSFEKIQLDFRQKLLPILTSTSVIGQKIELVIEAQTSKVPVGKEVGDSLKKEGYDATNEGLAEARLDTLEEIINELLYTTLKGKDEKKEAFLQSIKPKLVIVKKALPNQGPEYKPEDKGNLEKFKPFQKMSTEIKVTGDKIPDANVLRCKGQLESQGDRGTKQNLFTAFEKNLYPASPLGKQFVITFDPLTTPDSFVYIFNGEIKITPFAGSHGGFYIPAEANPATEAKLKAQGKVYKKIEFGGKSYFAIDFKKELNEVFNKNGELIKAIDAKLKQMGETRSIKEISPEFFDSEGLIEVYATSPTRADQIFKLTVDAIKAKALPEPKLAPKGSFVLDFTRNYSTPFLKLAVFSPLSGTNFKILSECK